MILGIDKEGVESVLPSRPVSVDPEGLDPVRVEQTVIQWRKRRGPPFKGLKEFSVRMERTV